MNEILDYSALQELIYRIIVNLNNASSITLPTKLSELTNDLTEIPNLVSIPEGVLKGSEYLEKVFADQAQVNELIANKISAGEGHFNNLVANQAKVNELTANRIEAGEANLGTVKALQGIIKTLVTNRLLAGEADIMNLTADQLQATAGWITSAMILSITADQITSGRINTNLISIGSGDSDSDSLDITGSVMQFRDKNGVVRIQIGKDASDNFTLDVFDETGKGQLLSAEGIKALAVPDGILVNKMVADNANISGSKLDIDSVVERINDSGTKEINMTKIYLDKNKGTLSEMFSKIDQEGGIVTNNILTQTSKSLNSTISKQIGGIQVGGVNLLENSAKIDLSKPTYSNSVTSLSSDTEKFNNFDAYLMSDGNYIRIDFPDLKADTEYTLSFDISTSANSDQYTILTLADEEYQLGVAKKNSWSRLEKIFNSGPSDKLVRYVLININNTSGTSTNIYKGYLKNIKLEKGNKATDWTVAPSETSKEIETLKSSLKQTSEGFEFTVSDVKANAKAAVDNIQVGGRNLYIRTKDFSGDKWRNLNYWEDDGFYNGFTVKKRTGAWRGIYQEVTAQVGDVYTFSFYAKADGGKILTFVPLTSDSPHIGFKTISSNLNVTNSWARYSVTIEITSIGNTAKFRIENNSNTATTWICGLKLERGNRATDWTPAPEDVQNGIDAAQETADNAKTAANGANNIASNAHTSVSENFAAIKALEDRADDTGKSIVSISATQSEFSQTLSGLNGSVTAIKKTTDGIAETVKEFTEWVNFDATGMAIGNSDSGRKVKINEEAVEFKKASGQVTATFGEDVEIKNLVIRQGGTFTMGNFAFIPRSNGNLSIKYIGG